MQHSAIRVGTSLVLALVLSGTLPGADDPAAAKLLVEGRKAQDAKNYPVAIQHYRNLLAKHGASKEVPAARHGLGVCLIDGPSRDFAGAAEQLRMLAEAKDLPDQPGALYYLGLSERGLGLKELARPAANSKEEEQRHVDARKHFTEAGKQFAAAADLYAKRVKEGEAALTPDLEGATRSRCNQAEMLLQLDKSKEARDLMAPLLKEPVLEKTRYRNLARYYHGWGSFNLKDNHAAGRSLSSLAPFNDPSFATHARFLLGRVHHLDDERTEAGAAYEAVITEYDQQKKAAPQALRRPDQLKPAEKDRLEALVRDPAPEHVARACYYLGLLNYEAGRFADAQGRFHQALTLGPRSPLVSSAWLRRGASLVQGKQFLDAINVLQQQGEKDPLLADQVLYWLGRAWAGFDPMNPQGRADALKNAQENLRKAADKAKDLKDDPEAPARRAAILLELADVQQLAKKYDDAAAGYRQLLADKLLPGREAEVLQRLASALQLAGAYAESDKVCAQFLKEHPRSLMLPAILFRHAENAAFLCLAVEKEGKNPAEVKRLNEEAEKRYKVLVEKFPESEFIGRTRYGLATCLNRKGDLDKAREMLESVPGSDQVDDLANIPLLLTDWLIRSTPMKPEDALQAAKMQEQLTAATALLETYCTANPNGPQTAEALLKLGICKQRLALLNEKEKAAQLGSAGRRFDRIFQTFPQSPVVPLAVIEKARCFALAGNSAGAVAELQRFTRDLKKSPEAPYAMLQAGSLLRAMGKPADGSKLLMDCLIDNEEALMKDPARAPLIPLLHLHACIGIRESGNLAETKHLLTSHLKRYGEFPTAAEASLRLGQVLREEGLKKSEKTRQLLTTPAKLDDIAAALKALDAELKELRDAAQIFEARADQIKDKPALADVRARLLYDAAWTQRWLADVEIAAARLKLLQDQLLKKDGQGATILLLSDVPLSLVALPPAAKKARTLYEAAIAASPESPLSIDARIELSERLMERGENDAAIKLINEALDKEPPADQTDKLRVQLGMCRAARQDIKGALEQFETVTKNPKSTQRAAAYLRAGEAVMRAGDGAKAAGFLAAFRDQQPLTALPGVTDLGLLRLGQALALQQQWDQARAAFDRVVGQFGNGPWANDARYGIAGTWQSQKNYDNAINVYTQAAGWLTRTGALAQFQIGACRLEQKKPAEALAAFLAVPAKYAAGDVAAAALLEAARVQADQKQKGEAEKLLQQVAREFPKTKWAEAADKQLKALAGGAALTQPEAVAELIRPDAKRALSLPVLGTMVSERASLDDPAADMVMAQIMARSPVGTKVALPLVRLSLPDPFEFRSSNRQEAALARDPAAYLGAWPAAGF